MAGQSEGSWELEDHIRGTIYGQCIGDAVGILTEFMNKQQAVQVYAEHEHLEYEHKINDAHRVRWGNGDWTDDSDQMILIMETLLENQGKADPVEYSKKLLNWTRRGFKELGDHGGMGIGATTHHVVSHKQFTVDPHAAAMDIWEKTGRVVAPNGGIMRTSLLGIHQYNSMEAVIENTKVICRTTHADPRCVASCVAVTCAIALMLQRQSPHVKPDGSYDIEAIIKECYTQAKPCLEGKHYKKYKTEMKKFMFAKKISSLELDEKNSIGYTYKAMGAGFWVLRQADFRKAIEELVLEGGDADSNGSVAGALLGCKLGAAALPPTWRDTLLHKQWLDDKITKFLVLQEGSNSCPTAPV